MKYSFLIILLLGTLLISCSKDATKESELLNLKECPRVNLEWGNSVDVQVRAGELAEELTAAANCGKTIQLPSCGKDDLFEDSATIILGEWCSVFSPCDCISFPKGFTIAKQDELIAEATSLLALELTTCGIENASFQFEIENPVPQICDGFKIVLKVTATSFCCANVG